MTENKIIEKNGIHNKDGWSPIPNILFDCQDELELSDLELLFIIRIYRFSEGFSVKNERLSLCDRTIQKTRKSLHEKGLIDYCVKRERKADGTIITKGTTYNLSLLKERLDSIYLGKLNSQPASISLHLNGIVVPSSGNDIPITCNEVSDVEKCDTPILKEHYIRTSNKNIENTTTTLEKSSSLFSSTEIDEAKQILKNQAELIVFELKKDRYFENWLDFDEYPYVSKFINSLKTASEKEIVSFLQLKIYNPETKQIIPSINLLNSIASYVIEGIDNGSFLNENTGDLLAYSFSLFSRYEDRARDLGLFYSMKDKVVD